jgi:predicted ATP-grasp superfamily ATP-dependent carboligase
MSRPGRPVLLAGVTTRALAQSAARAGYCVTAIDAFGDRDLRAVATVILARAAPGQRRYGAPEAAAAGAHVRAEFVAYTSNFENYPSAVVRLAAGRRLLGNTAETLARVRNPFELMRVLRRHGLASPEVRSRPPGIRQLSSSWLMKPRKSGGGHGIRAWTRGDSIPRATYLQERISGIPGSISFAADGSTAKVLGFTRQLVGQADLAAGQFRYCGSILGSSRAALFPRQAELLERAGEVAGVITREFQLVGLNGIDFIARDGLPYPTEVNPRYSASMELIERAHGISMFEVHFSACEGELPSAPPPALVTHGKAIVFARRNSVVGELSPRMRRSWVADVPRPGERIPRGRPICTVFAEARQPEACRRLLSRRAAGIYQATRALTRRAA